MQNNLINMAINRIMSNNPQAKQLYESLKGKSANELKEYAENGQTVKETVRSGRLTR